MPLGALEMRRAFEPNGEYGRWLRTHDTVIRINGIVFVHGGVSLATSAMGCETINATVRKEISGGRPPAAAISKMFSSSDDGPLWYRGLAQEPEITTFAPTVTTILDRLGARAMVIGHTVALGRMATRFGGRIIQIDTGMLDAEFFPGGVASALEITGDTATAIYTNRRESLQFAGNSAERWLPRAERTPGSLGHREENRCLSLLCNLVVEQFDDGSRRAIRASISAFVRVSPTAWTRLVRESLERDEHIAFADLDRCG